MKLVLIDRKTGRSRSIPLRGFKFYATIAFAIAAVAAVSSVATYQWENTHAKLVGKAFEADLRKQVAEDVDHNKALIVDAKESAQQEITALTLRMAELQARLMRVDALGERLVDAAGFDKSEFDFSVSPAVGGPQVEDVEGALLPGSGEHSYTPPDFMSTLDQLSADVLARYEQLDVLQTLLASKKLQKETNVNGRPVRLGWLSSKFGVRTDPFTGKPAQHNGVDFAGKDGSDILSVGSGVVTWAGKRYGYGQMVEINHGGGFVTRYGHAKKVKVKVGDLVHKGQVVALMGSSGRSTGPHVHLEVHKNGKPVDPAKYVNTKNLQKQ